MINIPVNKEELHIILMCIHIPWWDYKTRFSEAESKFQQVWSKKILAMRDSESVIALDIDRKDLIMLTNLFDQGLKELIEGEDFHTIVGRDAVEGEAVSKKLRMALPNNK